MALSGLWTWTCSQIGALWATTQRVLGLADSPESLPIVLEPDDPPEFPDPRRAEADGLVAIGGDLSPARLLAAYRAGIFPWFNDETPILWWSPDPRAIIELDGLHISRRLARTLRSGKFRFTVNEAFEAVLVGCADRAEGSWITPEMHAAYVRLHEQGHALSLEVWHEDELVGGIYGVTIGGFFAGESMFSRERDASKVALVRLCAYLRERGYVLFDAQIANEHTQSLGAIEIPRDEYLRRLAEALPPT